MVAIIANHPKAKDIDISNQKGLDQLKAKAEYYGHYAEQLKVSELIDEIELLRGIVDKYGNN